MPGPVDVSDPSVSGRTTMVSELEYVSGGRKTTLPNWSLAAYTSRMRSADSIGSEIMLRQKQLCSGPGSAVAVELELGCGVCGCPSSDPGAEGCQPAARRPSPPEVRTPRRVASPTTLGRPSRSPFVAGSTVPWPVWPRRSVPPRRWVSTQVQNLYQYALMDQCPRCVDHSLTADTTIPRGPAPSGLTTTALKRWPRNESREYSGLDDPPRPARRAARNHRARLSPGRPRCHAAQRRSR